METQKNIRPDFRLMRDRRIAYPNFHWRHKDGLSKFLRRVGTISGAYRYSLTKEDVRDKLSRLIEESTDLVKNAFTLPKYTDFHSRDWSLEVGANLKNLTDYVDLKYEETKPIFALFAEYYLSSQDPEDFEKHLSKVESSLGLSKVDLEEISIQN